MQEAEILFEQRDRLGLITLNRPQALNALTYGMVGALDAQLDVWAGDDSIAVVAIRGAGERAFAAGGDIRALYDAGQGGATGARNFRFFADEYRLNTRIKRYPKPYIAVMDGIVMGGGVGVSIHGMRRIAGDRTVFAMPETGIGLFPDVGGTYFLPRLPGEVGMWLGLTGARLKTPDAVACGICDFHVPSPEMDELFDALARIDIGDREPQEAIDWIIESFARVPAGETVLHQHGERIDRCFGAGDVDAVIEELRHEDDSWTGEQLSAIGTKSPTSTRIAYRQIREGAGLGFEDCMRLEYRLARYCMTHPDFYEGVRATILDKDGAPKWSPPTLADVTDPMIDEAFAPLDLDELVLPRT